MPDAAITGLENLTPAMVRDKSGVSSFERGDNGMEDREWGFFSGKIKISPGKTGPSLQQRLLPSFVVMVQPKQAPIPQAMADSMLKYEGMPASLQTFWT